MTVQELVSSLGGYDPSDPVRLVVTTGAPILPTTSVYDIGSLAVGGEQTPATGQQDVHLVAGAEVPC